MSILRSWQLPLLLLVAVVYLPFFGHRVARTAGDEKIYVQQAVEMERVDNWFVQILHGEPNYHKGPAHYVLVRLGYKIFGWSPWAVVYMNFVLLACATLALGALLRRYSPDLTWIAGAFAVCNGVHSFTFASQMEIEVTALLTIGLYFLDRSKSPREDWMFWVIAGMTGWFKSPLHSAFLGSTALLFWGLTGGWRARVKSPLAWASAFFGVVVCVLPYLPAALLDTHEFWRNYVSRESLQKKWGNFSRWDTSLWPILTYFLLPWMFVAFVSYADLLTRIRAARPQISRLAALGLSALLPSVLFFIWHRYRGDNYNLPVIAGVFLLIAAAVSVKRPVFLRLYGAAVALTACSFLILAAAVAQVTLRFRPLPEWWPEWSVFVLFAGALTAASVFTMAAIRWRSGIDWRALVGASAAFYLALGGLMTVFGERELDDLRSVVSQERAEGRAPVLTYYNLHYALWSEAGLMGFMMGQPVRALQKEQELIETLTSGGIILLPGDEYHQALKDLVARELRGSSLQVWSWRRWKTQGRNSQGQSLLSVAWRERDLTLLEKTYFIARLKL